MKKKLLSVLLCILTITTLLVGCGNKNKSDWTEDKEETKNRKKLLKNQQHNECWFLDRMKSVLNNDISEYPYGCKISNTHIRISSRIHLNDFYEAELLFHNLGNVYRFAYLIASDILKSVKDNNEEILSSFCSTWNKNTLVFMRSLSSLFA